MHQSGKIVAYCSAALSVAAITSFVTLSVVIPRLGTPEAVSEQAKTPPGGAAAPSEQVLALAAAVSGPDPQPAAPDPAQAASPPLPPAPAAPQAGETEAPPPQWSTAEVAAALMECVNLLAPVAADVIPLAPIRYNDCGTPAPVLLEKHRRQGQGRGRSAHADELPHGRGAQSLDGKDGAARGARHARLAGGEDRGLRLCLPQPLQPAERAPQPACLRRRHRPSGVLSRRWTEDRSWPLAGVRRAATLWRA